MFAVWRESPCLAKYRRNEFFDQYYEQIFDGLNAAQMVMAVLIFRYCDGNRKKPCEQEGVREHRPYSRYFMSYMAGMQLLEHFDIKLEELTHANFDKMKKSFEKYKELVYNGTETAMVGVLKHYSNCDDLPEIDGRTMAAAFRRFDIVERYLKNKRYCPAPGRSLR